MYRYRLMGRGISGKRTLIQTLAAIVSNGYVAGFVHGTIYTGRLKTVCVPGLNCYSCPGALGSCPIGALQSVLASRQFGFSFYALGFLLFFGALWGRFVCGFLCPFGFIQDLLHRLPGRKLRVASRVDRPLRLLKYALLLFLVILLPMLLNNSFGFSKPFFCQWVCPAGTLTGGIPLILANESLRNSLGFLFSWKMAILIAVIIGSILIYRPFCKYLCPLGAIYALCNRFSLYRMRVDEHLCIDCGRCERICPMQVEVRHNINSPECIRCGRCRGVCPTDAISGGFAACPAARPAGRGTTE
ncbi:MAG: 4Fe-4S binding protein [Clostridia bacterium]|nr:4Fe-4S binding protein [Clostridia bacterium]